MNEMTHESIHCTGTIDSYALPSEKLVVLIQGTLYFSLKEIEMMSILKYAYHLLL